MVTASTSRYEVLARIAAGGMATVYVGRVRGAVGFSRLVAIKRPHPFVTADAELHKQLEHEARVASMIHHPNVVAVLDVEEIGGEIVLIMSYVEGCTVKDLFQHVATTGASIDRILLRILLDAAAGLHAAHCLTEAGGAPLGVVHRDVSPHNILVGLDGVARLTDFGIAKIATMDGDQTATDVLKGKVAYLPPEYLETKTFDAKSDLFALGVVTWEALARQRLFKGATTFETIRRIVENRPPLLGTIRPELRVFEALIAQALAHDPAERPGSVETFAASLEALARAQDGVATHAEVRSFMESFVGEQIAARRRLLEAASPRPLIEQAASPTDRDDVVTLSFDAEVAAAASGAGGRPRPLLEAPSRRKVRAWIALFSGVFVTVAVALGISRRAPIAATPTEADAGPPAEEVSSASAIAPVAMVDGGVIASTEASVHRSLATPRARPPRTPPASALVPTHAPPNPYAK